MYAVMLVDIKKSNCTVKLEPVRNSVKNGNNDIFDQLVLYATLISGLKE